MAKVLVNESSLTGIADAIRGKNGETTTYKPSEMAAAITAISGGGEPVIEALSVTSNGTYTAPDGVDGYSPVTVNVPQDGGPPESAFVIRGDCIYLNYNGHWDWFFNNYGYKIITKNLTGGTFMFYNSKIEEINFDINFSSGNFSSIDFAFSGCINLIKIKKINNLKVSGMGSLFKDCNKLRNIPDDFASSWNWSYLEGATDSYSGDQSSIFQKCFSLRSFPITIIKSGNHKIYYHYNYFYNGFYRCYNLDELVDLPIIYTNATWNNNGFYNTFLYCSRLKNITFAKQEDRTPYAVNWKNQTIDLSIYVGYAINKVNILNYNSGITADKEVTDDASYQALKNDPDWFTTNVAYSRYNHDSAVATINSLPDTSAYLASAGGTNTIKFKGAAGSATDGGAISSLTPEEIAVATSRGWTVSFV